MESPVAARIGINQEADALSGLHIDCMLANLKFSFRRFKLAEHSVQMNRVVHHSVIVQNDAEFFPISEMQRFGIGKLHAIE